MMKILGKIDLRKFSTEKQEKINLYEFKNILDNQLLDLSKKTNNENDKILNTDGTIMINDEFDSQMIEEQEKAFFQNEKNREEWQRKNELKESSLAEKAITLLLNKGLGEQFIVVRASLYDDYNNGVDNVIVDKKSGNVVCGFDDVLGNIGDDGKEKKAKKVSNKMKKGGVSLKYGLSFNQEKLEICQQKNLPAFYISLSKKELTNLWKIFKENKKSINQEEKNILIKWLISMKEQIDYYGEMALNYKLKSNLINFKKSLDDMEKIINKIV